ncbi:hypothetical protein [Subtercola boreus]|uniref:Uncharacterized protein n=1 Tax=Subtercola boreus TaxID=120213 RepID=A0A3E0W9W3_9MICO|nr:hypothetical protein [Subtercola boreus]RFA19289.1 hypothetical protein B7R24_11570 [Subtercola boreus]RFA19549.1 hypothetical protein B7R23_11550 [Subtercola boreus]RFA25915.1 hypothetical protein B7R25_11670 [Subtercola boreus]
MTQAPDDRGAALPLKRVGRRRVTTAPAPGRDGEPGPEVVPKPGPRRASDADSDRAAEDTLRAWGDPTDDNDSRLREDVPPHY